jgi:acetyl esterase
MVRQTTTAARRPRMSVLAARALRSATPGLGRTRHPDVVEKQISAPVGARTIPCRLFTPTTAQALAPLIVFAHGGGFIVCDIATHRELCRVLAAVSRLRVLSVDYTLAPEASVEEEIEQVAGVCRWVEREGGESLGGPATSLCLAGDSAGAYLSASASLRLNAERPGAIALQLLLYPLVHVDDAVWSTPAVANLRFAGRIAVGLIRRALGTPLPSLLDLDVRAAPPTIIVTGGLDPTTADAGPLAAHLRRSAVQVDEVRFRRLPHGGFSMTHLSGSAHRMLAEVALAVGERLQVVAEDGH